MSRYVSAAPFDPTAADARLVHVDERLATASNWQLIWWKLRRHRLAMVLLLVLGLFYLMAGCAGFFAPNDPQARYVDYIHAPPQGVTLWHNGGLVPPSVHPRSYMLDIEALHRR